MGLVLMLCLYGLSLPAENELGNNNNTGNSPSKFKYAEEFDFIYGNRASSIPTTMDTGKKRQSMDTEVPKIKRAKTFFCFLF